MNRALATELETVAVAVVCIVSERNVARLTVVVCNVNTITLELVEPLLVGLVASVLANVILLRAVVLADAILNDCTTVISC